MAGCRYFRPDPQLLFQPKRSSPLPGTKLYRLVTRDTQVWVACPRPLCNGAQTRLKPATCESLSTVPLHHSTETDKSPRRVCNEWKELYRFFVQIRQENDRDEDRQCQRPCVYTDVHHNHEDWHIWRHTGTLCSTGSHVLSYHNDTSYAPSHGTVTKQDNTRYIHFYCRHYQLIHSSSSSIMPCHSLDWNHDVLALVICHGSECCCCLSVLASFNTSRQFFVTCFTGCQYISRYHLRWSLLPLIVSAALVQPTSNTSACWSLTSTSTFDVRPSPFFVASLIAWNSLPVYETRRALWTAFGGSQNFSVSHLTSMH